jgi:nitroreductase
MELDEVIRARRMVRRYTDEPVDPAVVERALGRAVRAPSAGFTQGWAFLVLDRPADVVAFWTAATPPGRGTDAWSSGMRRAPVVVVPWSSRQAYLDRYAEPDKGWSDDGTAWPVPYWHVDAGMAAMLMLLSVVDDGLGACFFGVPGERVRVLREAFWVPESYTPVGAVTIGHPDVRAARRHPRRRRPMSEVVHRGRWDG